jgi:hypothetical protein
MTHEERQEFLKVLRAHLETVAIGDACAATTRDLAAEVARGSTPSRDDLLRTVAEAERVMADLVGVRTALQEALAQLGERI